MATEISAPPVTEAARLRQHGYGRGPSRCRLPAHFVELTEGGHLYIDIGTHKVQQT